ncbi:MAG: VWA domain-containing protein [Holophagales bacterium]|nr:VWA domain-containing protein [Holophagales bacterium]MYH26781.1 VWA domain-containing protein [Holophagales bacterium]
MTKLKRNLIVLAGLLLIAAGALAQQQEDLPAVFSEVIDVRVVNIEVVVTDRDGNRVHGLKASDFELLVDGEATPIDYFTEIEEGRALASADGEAVAGVPNLEPDAPVGTSFLLFIDDFFTIKRDRDRVIDRLEQDLTQLGPADRVAAVSFDGKQVDMLTTWTNSPSQLSDALREARRRKAHGLMRLGELRTNDQERREQSELRAIANRFIEDGGVEPPEDVMRNNLRGSELRYATNLENQLERSVLAAVATLRSFANRPGRKVMLLLAGGWPESPALYTVAAGGLTADSLGAASDTRLMSQDDLYGPLVSAANLIGYTLYPVDVPGFRPAFALDASAALDSNSASDPSAGAGAFQERELLQHTTLQLLARSTGGVPMINAERDTALADAIADTRSYYWLGFQPLRREDDEVHDVEVRLVNHPDFRGLRVRSREGYVDMSRSAEVTMMVEGSLLFGNPPSAKPLGVRFGRPQRRGLGKMVIPLQVSIPLDEVQLLPVAGVWQNELEFRVTVMDKHGNRSETPVEKVRIAGPQEPQPGQFFTYQTGLELRRREHTFVIAVYDPLTGAILSSSGEIGVR